MTSKPIAVLGAGNGGLALAAYSTLRGYSVNLYNRSEETIDHLLKKPEVVLHIDDVTETTQLNLVTTSIEDVLRDVSIIFVVTPAPGHLDLVEGIAKFAPRDATVVLLPGWVCGALWLKKSLVRLDRQDLKVAETNTLPFVTRKSSPGEVVIFRTLNVIHFGAYPATLTAELLELVEPILPMLQGVKSVFQTGLTNYNPVVHAPGMVLNGGWIEATEGDFTFYYQGFTPAVGAVMNALDRERMSIQKQLCLPVVSFTDYFYEAGYVGDEVERHADLLSAVRSSRANQTIMAPASLQHRFLLEDVTFGLVPLSYLARACEIDVPTTRSLISLAGTMIGRDFEAICPSAEELGISGSFADLKVIAEGGV